MSNDRMTVVPDFLGLLDTSMFMNKSNRHWTLP
ncbi:Uncharacterised protein [Escherichia coli]|nr:Uncharacterised protein [Escherichia coli]STF58880.1 Uncharacterised protein [Escherichia coli]